MDGPFANGRGTYLFAGRKSYVGYLVKRINDQEGFTNTRRYSTFQMLDGDVIRTHLSKRLGFSKEDRETNIRRIGYVASEVVRHGGGVICAAISPYGATRNECRTMIGSDRFCEIFVATPLEVCEDRDPKGMYALAREGKMKGFTGIDDPYEPPHNPEITLDTVNCSAEENAERIVMYLIEHGFIRPAGTVDEIAYEEELQLAGIATGK